MVWFIIRNNCHGYSQLFNFIWYKTGWANNVAIISSIGPVSTILQAHFILDEPIFAAQIIGTLMVVSGVVLTGWKRNTKTGH